MAAAEVQIVVGLVITAEGVVEAELVWGVKALTAATLMVIMEAALAEVD
jgi:hypothetical protein